MALLDLADIAFGYRRGNRIASGKGRGAPPASGVVLSRLSLTVETGSVTAILGPNGVGKTTLLNICLGWLRPWRGTVALQGRPLAAFSRRELGQRISLVPQSEHIPFEYTVVDYVLLGRAPYISPLASPGTLDIEVCLGMLARVGMRDRSGDSVHATSAGEKQLIMLARSLAQEPELLLLDEPSAHLDLKNKRHLIDLLRVEVDRGATILLTAHEPEFAAAVADNIMLMHDGTIMISGPTDAVLTGENLSRAYDLPVAVHEVDGQPTFHW